MGGRPATAGRVTRRRSCAVCRVTADKRALHRIVRAPDGSVGYDPSGTAAGRGAYLCGRADCLDLAVRRRRVQRALRSADAAAAAHAVAALRQALAAGVEEAGEAGLAALPGEQAGGTRAARSAARESECQEEVRTG